MTIEITNQVRIQEHPEFWYTVEDTYLDVGCYGCIISSWYSTKDAGDKRNTGVCMNSEEALAIADAIYKIFKKDN